MKKRILILNGQYWPGYKGGGPIQSCINMVENLSDNFEFMILTSDRDYKSDKPYENIKINEWNQIGSAKVYYMSPDRQTMSGFKRVINSTDSDIIYLNGFFSPIFTIKPLLLRRFGLLKKCKIILTPRGDFTGGCENKKLKKYTYISLCKLVGLYRNLLWHSTSELEEKNIKEKFSKVKTFVVPNLPAKFISKETVKNKKNGEVRLLFLSRIFPKKNLKFALEVLKEVKNGNVIFDIYGPMEDESYWYECTDIIRKLPTNVTVNYKGEVYHNDIPHVFEQYHAFFFPTLGENYGHVIVESMMNNCLCILSRGVTPWDDYAENGGFVESLSSKDQFVKVIEKLLMMDEQEINERIAANNKYVQKKIDCKSNVEKYKIMLG